MHARRVRLPLQAQLLHTGYWISGDYFRQTSRRESAGDAGESDIEGEARRDTRDNDEATRLKEGNEITYKREREGYLALTKLCCIVDDA